jgi:hypothetical protein
VQTVYGGSIYENKWYAKVLGRVKYELCGHGLVRLVDDVIPYLRGQDRAATVVRAFTLGLLRDEEAQEALTEFYSEYMGK